MTPAATARTERYVLIAAILASALAFIDQTALDIASPSLQADLNMTGTQLLWVANAYALFLASLLLVGGALGDLYGRRRIFMIGITLFAGFSMLCGLAPSAEILILARALQGIGGALMVPGSLAILSSTFPEERRGGAIGIWSAFSMLTTLLGPVVGGWLAQQGLWRAVFFVNLPLGAVAFYLLSQVSSGDERSGGKLDWGGAVSITAALAMFTLGTTIIQDAAQQIPALILIAASVIALFIFIRIESTTQYPLIPLKLFRNRTFAGTTLFTFLLYGAIRAAPYFQGLNLQQIQGYPADVAGFTMLPFGVLMIVLSTQTRRLINLFGVRTLLTVGPLLIAVGMILLTFPRQTTGPDAYFVTYFPTAILFGLGMGIVAAPLTTTVMNSAPRENSGAASGINNAVSRVGAVIALTVIGGIGVTYFQGGLNLRAETLPLTEPQRDALATESVKLGATTIPEGLDPAAAGEVGTAIRSAFLDVHGLVQVLGATLCVISAGVAFVSIRSGIKREEQAAAPIPLE